ncbi:MULTISPECIES: DUF2934 domain-containing protein [Methylobacterium]|uniref:Protein of unassigned function n=1 Tax=Methylobacterium oryzae CBMB20 TaxID=693986 RepID=A0A089P094_9HYPH|nr:protein of unassigned function [Methylobacterium oryzae CBMB20]AWV15491.1 hypothetical protein A3862_08160 [Methylobacterium sp. XJLW]
MDVPPDFRPPPELPAAATPSVEPGPSSGSDDAVTQPPARSPDALTFEQIRERAYELWERNHRPEGFEIEFWLLAERELRKERERRKSADRPNHPASGSPPA